MTIENHTAFVGPVPRPGLTRRGLITGGLGLVGAGAMLPTGAYAALEAANNLVTTDYRRRLGRKVNR